MEVLQGNQSDPKHSRRRSDAISLGDSRALDWGSLDSDISLYPHSPLAFTDVFSSEGGVLDLIPSEPQTSSDNSESLNRRKSDVNEVAESKRTTRRRSNLLTRHSGEELMRQCKKNLVENALIKSKGDRQLYLAAGFISWQDSTDAEGERRHAPILLFPALLVRVPEESRYELRIAGDTPEFNLAFAEHAEQRYEVSIPEYEAQMPLSDYFANVAQSIRHSKILELEFDIALGSASLLHQETSRPTKVDLPDVPANFDIGLAMSIANNKSLLQLNAVLQLIPNYSPSTAELHTLPHAESAANLRKYAAKLAAEGLDHVEFRQLIALPPMITKWVSSVREGLNTDAISQHLDISQMSARELIRLSSIIELIDKAPSSLDQLGHGDLCYANSTLLLRRAEHQSKLIEDELAALQEHFVLDKVPAKSQLLSLMNELGGTVEMEHDYVDAEYFSARRQFMEFSIQKPSNLTANHRRMLSQLVKVLRFRELFVNNTEYRAALGPGYKGLRTDWTVLNQTSDYARELAEVLESETIAASIVSNWQEFRSHYCVELDVLQNAADSCRRLLGTVGTRWQTKKIESVLEYALQVSTKLNDWRDTYGDVESHAEKTPAMVLSSFSGKSRDDVVVEAQVDDTRSQINQQLESGEISREQISDTLQWLLDASTTATENELDIHAIVEHLQIA